MTTHHFLTGALLIIGIISSGCEPNDAVTEVDPLANYYNARPTSDSATSPSVKIGIGIEGGGYYLSWQDCPQASHYEIESGNVQNNWNWRLVFVTEETSYRAGEVPGNLQQKYRVRAVYEQYNSSWTEISFP